MYRDEDGDIRRQYVERRRALEREPRDGWIAGICAGLGRYFHLDPSLVRIVAVFGLLTLTSTTIIAYLIAWAVVPSSGWNANHRE